MMKLARVFFLLAASAAFCAGALSPEEGRSPLRTSSLAGKRASLHHDLSTGADGKRQQPKDEAAVPALRGAALSAALPHEAARLSPRTVLHPTTPLVSTAGE